jgi:S1-C subfamily serine protease
MLLALPGCFRTDKDLFSANRAKVVEIVIETSDKRQHDVGTGFFIRDGKTIVTAKHVVPTIEGVEYYAVTDSGAKYLVKDVWRAVHDDVAILTLATEAVGVNAFVFGDLNLEVGERVYCIGFPAGEGPVYSTGFINNPKPIEVEPDPGVRFVVVSISADAYFGNSGGPVFNENDEIVGILVGLMRGTAHVRYMVPIETLEKNIASFDGGV